MSNHHILTEEPSLKIDTLSIKSSEQDNSTDNASSHIPKNQNEIYLIFRNQTSNDTIILIDKAKIKTIDDIINILFNKLNISKEEKFIRLFFKGRPLLKNEKIEDIRK